VKLLANHQQSSPKGFAIKAPLRTLLRDLQGIGHYAETKPIRKMRHALYRVMGDRLTSWDGTKNRPVFLSLAFDLL
jgi:hypothetical protein